MSSNPKRYNIAQQIDENRWWKPPYEGYSFDTKQEAQQNVDETFDARLEHANGVNAERAELGILESEGAYEIEHYGVWDHETGSIVYRR